MTREEKTHERDLRLNDWVREKLPDSYTGFRVSDLDFVIWDEETNDLMLVEAKRYGSKVKGSQYKLLKLLDQLIRLGAPLYKWPIAPATWKNKPPIKYHGVHCLLFERTFFDDGKTYIDKVGVSMYEEVTEQEVIEFLSFRWKPYE